MKVLEDDFVKESDKRFSWTVGIVRVYFQCNWQDKSVYEVAR